MAQLTLSWRASFAAVTSGLLMEIATRQIQFSQLRLRKDLTMDLTTPFVLALIFAVITAVLDWNRAVHLIKQYGPKGERNPVMRFFIVKNPVLGLIWKIWPIALTAIVGFAKRDVPNFGAKWGDAPGRDYWAAVWIGAALLAGAVSLWGFLNSNGVKK